MSEYTFETATKKPGWHPAPRWSVEARLLGRVEVNGSGCWIWLGSTMPGGYGQITVDRRVQLVHRVAHELFIGPIPSGYQVDHLCRIRNCVNPEHLEAVTQAENLRRQGAAVTHCPRGHEYTRQNTFIGGRGGRVCRVCSRERQRRTVSP